MAVAGRRGPDPLTRSEGALEVALRLDRIVRRQGLDLGPDHGKGEAVRLAPGGVLLGPGPAVGDPGLGHRVSAQELRRLARVLRALLQALEECGHAPRVEAGPGERGDAHPVRLRLVRPGEVDLQLQGARLGRCDGGHARLAALGGEQHRRRQGGERGDCHLARRLEAAGDVALGHVGDLVSEDRRELTLGLRGQDQAGVHGHVTAGRREGVDAGVLDDEEGEALGTAVAVGHDPLAEALQIGLDLGVLQDHGVPAQCPHQRLADGLLALGGQHGTRGRPDVRQLDAVGRDGRGERQRGAGQNARAGAQPAALQGSEQGLRYLAGRTLVTLQ